MRLWGRRAVKGLGGLGKKQKGGVVPLVLAAPREGLQGGRAGIDHPFGTRRHLQFPENPEDRTEAEQHSFSHSAAVCVHCPATFPLHAFWRAWARKIINLATISSWRKKKDHHRISDAGTAGSRLLWALGAANPMGNPLVRHGCGIRTGHLGSGRQRWQVAFLKAILTLHRETLHFDRRQAGMTYPLRLHPLAFASADTVRQVLCACSTCNAFQI